MKRAFLDSHLEHSRLLRSHRVFELMLGKREWSYVSCILFHVGCTGSSAVGWPTFKGGAFHCLASRSITLTWIVTCCHGYKTIINWLDRLKGHFGGCNHDYREPFTWHWGQDLNLYLRTIFSDFNTNKIPLSKIPFINRSVAMSFVCKRTAIESEYTWYMNIVVSR